MKRILILFLGILVLSCASCDSDNTDISSQNLLGKWYLKGGTTDNGLFENYEHNCANNKDYQEFASDGKLTFNSFNNSCVIVDTDVSDWILKGNKLTVSSQHFDPMLYEYIFIVEKLTVTELVLKQTIIDAGGTYDYRLTLTRD
jgi:hypothetical protein